MPSQTNRHSDNSREPRGTSTPEATSADSGTGRRIKHGKRKDRRHTYKGRGRGKRQQE